MIPAATQARIVNMNMTGKVIDPLVDSEYPRLFAKAMDIPVNSGSDYPGGSISW
jgi:hypothetical protein